MGECGCRAKREYKCPDTCGRRHEHDHHFIIFCPRHAEAHVAELEQELARQINAMNDVPGINAALLKTNATLESRLTWTERVVEAAKRFEADGHLDDLDALHAALAAEPGGTP